MDSLNCVACWTGVCKVHWTSWIDILSPEPSPRLPPQPLPQVHSMAPATHCVPFGQRPAPVVPTTPSGLPPRMHRYFYPTPESAEITKAEPLSPKDDDETSGRKHHGGKYLGGKYPAGMHPKRQSTGGKNIGGKRPGGKHLGGKHVGGKYPGGKHLGGKHVGGKYPGGKPAPRQEVKPKPAKRQTGRAVSTGCDDEDCDDPDRCNLWVRCRGLCRGKANTRGFWHYSCAKEVDADLPNDVVAAMRYGFWCPACVDLGEIDDLCDGSDASDDENGKSYKWDAGEVNSDEDENSEDDRDRKEGDDEDDFLGQEKDEGSDCSSDFDDAYDDNVDSELSEESLEEPVYRRRSALEANQANEPRNRPAHQRSLVQDQGRKHDTHTRKPVRKVRSRKSRPSTSGSGPLAGKPRGKPWSSAEDDACIQLMDVINSDGTKYNVDDKFDLCSERMAAMGFIRTGIACKQQWARSLRARSGVDERKKPNPKRMVTSELGNKRGKTKTQTQSRRRDPNASATKNKTGATQAATKASVTKTPKHTTQAATNPTYKVPRKQQRFGSRRELQKSYSVAAANATVNLTPAVQPRPGHFDRFARPQQEHRQLGSQSHSPLLRQRLDYVSPFLTAEQATRRSELLPYHKTPGYTGFTGNNHVSSSSDDEDVRRPGATNKRKRNEDEKPHPSKRNKRDEDDRSGPGLSRG